MVDADATLARQTVDLDLLQRAVRGDNVAFDRLLRPRLERLYRIARAILHDDAAARDVTQDSCVRAWRRLNGLRDPERFDAWLTQIVVNGCRTQLRRQRMTDVREIHVDATDSVDKRMVSPASPLIDDVIGSESIRRAFRRLDPDKRTLLVLHYVEAWPLADIAAALGAPTGTIKWRLSRARDALERALEAER